VFPVVALPGVGQMPAKGEHEQEAARVFYVAATRATQRLVIEVGGPKFLTRLAKLPGRDQARKPHHGKTLDDS
jgi:superfamily I DNA/RNA helicase